MRELFLSTSKILCELTNTLQMFQSSLRCNYMFMMIFHLMAQGQRSPVTMTSTQARLWPSTPDPAGTNPMPKTGKASYKSQ